jgi:diguanylate cyclase (GGDEF)-like protein
MDSSFTDLLRLTGVVALTFQIVATALIALLSYVIARSVQRRLMLTWSVGWLLYCIALTAILAANLVEPLRVPLYFAYFFCEYAAVLSIFRACYYLGRRRVPHVRWWLALGVVLALLLAGSFRAFSIPFVLHGAVMGIGWVACLLALWPAIRRPAAGAGIQIVAVGLALLAADYLQHLPTALILLVKGPTFVPYYYTITTLIDGVLDLVLGFGSVVVIVDVVRAELEVANLRLMTAHQRTEEALHKDPLTGTLNRYSFLGAFGGNQRSTISGVVVVVDVDDLKRINDSFGHAAGDEAIRAVARALVSLVRADDPVYRWGGDEFVVVMINATRELAERRMEQLPVALDRESRNVSRRIGSVTASVGVATFDPGIAISSAIEQADAAMYESKRGNSPVEPLRSVESGGS